MTGRTHLLVGLAAGFFVAHTAGVQGFYIVPCVLMGGVGGLLPDIDHPKSIISGYMPGSGVLRLAISHRGPTHTLLGLALLLLGMVISIAILTPYLPGEMLDTGAVYHVSLAVLSVFTGYVLHLICDMATPAGIPLLWPFSRRAFRIAPRQMLWASAWILESIATVGALALVGAIVIGVV